MGVILRRDKDKDPSIPLGLHLSPEEFKCAARLRIGAHVFPYSSLCSLESCSKISDSLGYHALNCAGSDTKTARHNYIRDAIFNSASEAGLAPKKEQSGLFDDGNQRPGDVSVPNWF